MHRPSKCLHPRCGGIFAATPFVEPNRTCQSCGAGIHWEGKSPWLGDVNVPVYAKPVAAAGPGHIIDPLDWDGVRPARVSSSWLLQMDARNHGSRKAVLYGLAALEGDEKNAGHRVGRTQYVWKRNDYDVEEDFLKNGRGWIPENAGTTGTPIGRPVKGVTKPDYIDAAVARVWDEVPLHWRLMFAGLPGRTAAHVFIWLVLDRGRVNTKAWADKVNRDRSTVYRHGQNGRKWLEKNLLYLLVSEDPVTTEVLNRLSRIEHMLAQQALVDRMRGEVLDSVHQTVEKLASRDDDEAATKVP